MSIRRPAAVWVVFGFLRYVCLGECLACVIESQFPLAAVLTLASAVQIHFDHSAPGFSGERVSSSGFCLVSLLLLRRIV